MGNPISELRRRTITAQVKRAVDQAPVFDIHTHLYEPAFGELLLWGIDELLVYHYMVAEVLRQSDLSYPRFWALSKPQQAGLIWEKLFIEHSPVSEACRGVITTLNRLGLDVKRRDLRAVRKWFASQKPAAYVTRVMETANVHRICMTNSPFDEVERPVWERGFDRDKRFVAGSRIDPLLLDWPAASKKLSAWGYKVARNVNDRTISEVRRFLDDWSAKIDARYLMVSLPPDFAFPAKNDGVRILEGAVLPHCRDSGRPFAMMPGVRRAVNPLLLMAGDGMGRCDLRAYENLLAAHPENRFLMTVLARENQHELCVLARKFRNLHIFGCWWFTNVPSVIEEMTRMRMELLGLGFTPQHSDARVMDQLIYKWDHSRAIISRVLADKYCDLAESGWEVTPPEIKRDVSDLLGGAFERFCKG